MVKAALLDGSQSRFNRVLAISPQPEAAHECLRGFALVNDFANSARKRFKNRLWRFSRGVGSFGISVGHDVSLTWPSFTIQHTRMGSWLVFPFQHDCYDRRGIIAGAAECPELDQLVASIATNVNQNLKVDSIAGARFAASRPEHEENVPKPPC